MNNIKKTIGIYSMKKNYDGSGRNVFFFNDSPDLQKLIAKYKATRKG